MIPIFKPSYTDEEWYALREVLKSGWTGLGPNTAVFEQRFAEYTGAQYAVATNSCTAALHLSMLVCGIGSGDEVLVPAMTFVSTAHSVMYLGATPIFVDIEPDTLTIDLQDIKRKVSPKTKAIVPVHYGGHPCRMDEILDIAPHHHLAVIEDAAHACGADYKGQKIGGLNSNATCFSFQAVKNLSTGDGGMITTNDSEVYEKLKRLRWVGIDKNTWERTGRSKTPIPKELSGKIFEKQKYDWYYEVNDLGFKYHMNDISATLGLVQLQKLDKMNARRRQIVKYYNEQFKGCDWIQIPTERDFVYSACHNYVIKTPYRNELNLYLKDLGIATGVHYMPVNFHPFYLKLFKTNTPVANKIWERLLTLPLYPDLSDAEVEYIVESIMMFPKKT